MKLINFNIRKNSIRTKSIQDKFNLIAIVFLIFISISFISISSILSHDIITTMITKENLENVKGYSNLVSNVINRRFRDIKLYAEDPVVKTMDWKQIKPYLEGLENESTEQCCFIGLVDKNEVLTTNKSEVTLNINNFQTLKNSIKNNYYFIDSQIETGKMEVIDNQLIVHINKQASEVYQTIKLTNDDVYLFYTPSINPVMILIISFGLISIVTVMGTYYYRINFLKLGNKVTFDLRQDN